MIKYLKIKRRTKTKKDGSRHIELYYMEKDGKRGKVITEKSISIKKPVLICGRAASGKTRWIKRLIATAPEIWRKLTAPVIFLEANEAVTEWREQDGIIEWWKKNNPEKEWRKIPNPKKNKVLLEYVSQNWTVIFIDNIDRLTGRKLDLVKEMLKESKSKIWICSAIAENRINPSLRNFILKSNPQTFTLNSPVAYDATNALTILACVIFVIIGWLQAAIVLAGMRMAARGIFSSKQQ
jgi:adenosyl cobinamide kinase/adenosyl cobinamide phosphate guanylyltransferase